MDVHTHIPLKSLTTMKLGGQAHFFADIHTREELRTTYQIAASKNIPTFIIGGGSNLIGRDEGYDGLVLRIRILGFEVVADDLYSTTLKIGAGENWDEVVKRSVEMNLSGIETMSAIPGTSGAAPVQNVGAYGQEIAQTLTSLEAYDTHTDSFVVLQNDECGFGYRESIFRGSAMGRYIITSITLRLTKSFLSAPFYDSLQKYLDEHSITIFTPQIIRDAVIAVRSDKLPDPRIKPSAGSFFKNSIIETWQLDEIRKQFPDVKAYDMGSGKHKIYTGWLIEKAGFKGQLVHGMRINEKNCLVLINESATSYADLEAARNEIVGKVRDMFRITIDQEPLEITN